MPSLACDRCSRRKERCLMDPGASTCRRCVDKSAVCSFTRHQRRMGRRPRPANVLFGRCDVVGLEQFGTPPRAQSSPRAAPQQQAQATPPAPGQPTPEHTPGHDKTSPSSTNSAAVTGSPPSADAVQAVLTDEALFYALHQNFTIGRSFTSDFQAAVRSVSPSANGILYEVYAASLDLWDGQSRAVRTPNSADVARGTDCLRRLQDECAATRRSDDAAAILMAGQVLLVHHVAMMCTSAHSILRSSLLAVEPFYASLLDQPALDPITVTPILVDTIESLVRRESPVISTRLCRRYIVDRSVGLCWSLLELLQELCHCSVRARSRRRSSSTNMAGPDLLGDDFSDIEARIRRWEPWPRPDVFARFTPHEVSAMMLQARLYRIAALLIIHRLRYPLGVRDDEARVGASVIMAELASFMAWAPAELRALPIGLPLLVAMLETREPGDAIVRQLAMFASYPRYESEFRRFVDLVWDAKDNGFQESWLDLAAQFQMPMLP